MLKRSNLKPVRNSLFFLAFLLSISTLGASAQAGFSGNKKDLPDGSSFYMSRRQYQIVDDSPIVKMGNGQAAPGSAQGGPVNANGAPLTRAGFTSYTSAIPTINKPLPKVHNGVPVQSPVTPPPSSSKKSLKAKAGSLGKTKVSSPAAPSTARSYESYKGYNPSEGGDYGYSAGASTSSQANVRGSVLHWSRKRRPGQ